MPLLLDERATTLREAMDASDCDLETLERTYANFTIINRWLSRWQQLFQRWLVPQLRPHQPNSLLDIGCGGGDVARMLLAWAQQAGYALQVTGIDNDARAIAYAERQKPVPGLHFRQVSSQTLLAEGARFDIVISNHLLHHLNPQELPKLCRDSQQLSKRLVLHNDIERGDVAYLGFGLLTWPWFRRSFIREDGLRSIRRSYAVEEMHALLGAAGLHGWQVKRQLPYRLLLCYQHADEKQA